MILIGDSIVPYEDISKISKIEDIQNTVANSTLLFAYDEKLMKFCFENSLSYAVIIKSMKESIYANALRAKYIVCGKIFAKDIQKIAQNYMFDAKVLALILNSDEIVEIAKDDIDGVIYESLL